MAQAILARMLNDIQTLEPDELQLLELAIRARLPQQNGEIAYATPEQIEAANAMLRETFVTLPYVTGADNESIDADLAMEYE